MATFDDPEEAATLRPYFPLFAETVEEAVDRIRSASGNALIDVRPRTKTTNVTDTICRSLRKQFVNDPNVQFRDGTEVDMPIFFDSIILRVKHTPDVSWNRKTTSADELQSGQLTLCERQLTVVTLAYLIDQIPFTIKDIRLQHEVNKLVRWSIPIPFVSETPADLDRDPAVYKPELPAVNAKIQRQEGRDEAVES